METSKKSTTPGQMAVFGALLGTILCLALIRQPTNGPKANQPLIVNGEALQYNKGDLFQMEVIQTLPPRTEDNLFGYEVVVLRYPEGGVAEIAVASKGIDLTPGDKVTASWFAATKSGVSTSYRRMMMVHWKIEPIAQK